MDLNALNDLREVGAFCHLLSGFAALHKPRRARRFSLRSVPVVLAQHGVGSCVMRSLMFLLPTPSIESNS